jgi:hypothetical protein
MIVSITKLELKSYAKIVAFFGFNQKIIKELQGSNCKAFKVSPNWSFRTWYTMTLWESEADLLAFYRGGTHAEAMRQAANFSTNLKAFRTEGKHLISWNEAKQLLKQQ